MCCFPSTCTIPPPDRGEDCWLHAIWQARDSMLEKSWIRPLISGIPPSPSRFLLLFLYSSVAIPIPHSPVPHLSSFTSSLPFLLSPPHPRVCCLCTPIPTHLSHPHSPPLLSPLLIHFHVVTFHQWSAFLAQLPTRPTHSSLRRSLNGCEIKESGRWNHSSFHTRHPCGCGSSGMFHSEDCRSRESTLFVI